MLAEVLPAPFSPQAWEILIHADPFDPLTGSVEGFARHEILQPRCGQRWQTVKREELMPKHP